MKYAFVLHSSLEDSVKTYLHDPYQFEQFILHQAGEKVLDSGGCSLSTKHYFQLGMLLASSSHVRLDNDQLNTNDLILIPPNTEVKLQVPCEAQYAFVQFSLNDVASAAPFTVLTKLNKAIVIPSRMRAGGRGDTLISLISEMRQQNEYTQLLVGSYLNQLLVAVTKHLTAKEVPVHPLMKGDIIYDGRGRSEIVQQAMSYVDNQYMELRELKEIAQSMGYSYSYLSHVFRLEVGICLQEYYTNKKIMKAMQMLHNQESVTRVAEMLQYKSIHSFSKAFKRFTGLTPTNFQQQKGQSEVSM